MSSGELLSPGDPEDGKRSISGNELLRTSVFLRVEESGKGCVSQGRLLFPGEPACKVLVSGNERFGGGDCPVCGVGFVVSGELSVSPGASSGMVALTDDLPGGVFVLRFRLREPFVSGVRRGVLPGGLVSPGGVSSGKLSLPGVREPRAASTGDGMVGGVPEGGGASFSLPSPSPLSLGRTSPPPPASSPTLTPSSAG